MMPTAVTDLDGALHGQTVQLERGEEQVQQAGVVGILTFSTYSFQLLCR